MILNKDSHDKMRKKQEEQRSQDMKKQVQTIQLMQMVSKNKGMVVPTAQSKESSEEKHHEQFHSIRPQSSQQPVGYQGFQAQG